MATRRVVGVVTGKRRGWPRLKREMLQRWVGWRGGGCVAKQHEPDEGAHGFERGESQMRKSWGTVARMARMAEARGP